MLSGPTEGNFNRTHLVTGKFTLFRTTKDFVFYGLWPLTLDVSQDSVITEAAHEHNPTPPLTPLTAVAMEAVPELCPPKKETI